MKLFLGWTTINALGFLAVRAFDPSYAKWVIISGIASLIGFFLLTRQGKISMYGTQLVMTLIMIIHYT